MLLQANCPAELWAAVADCGGTCVWQLYRSRLSLACFACMRRLTAGSYQPPRNACSGVQPAQDCMHLPRQHRLSTRLCTESHCPACQSACIPPHRGAACTSPARDSRQLTPPCLCRGGQRSCRTCMSQTARRPCCQAASLHSVSWSEPSPQTGVPSASGMLCLRALWYAWSPVSLLHSA